MCDICNGLTMRQVVEKTKRGVARYGWMIRGVEPTLTTSPFAYTVGLTERSRHPEILMSGRPLREMARALNEMGHMVACHKHELTDGMTLELDRTVVLFKVRDPCNVVTMATRLYGYRVQALQAVWADDEGNLPWQQSVPDTLTQPLFCAPPQLKHFEQTTD